MTDENNSSSNPDEKTDSFLSRLFKGFVRLILVVLGGIAIAVCAYLAYILIFRELITQPTTDFQQAFSISETRQALAHERYDEKINEYAERISVLESQRSLDIENLDEMQSGMQALQTTLEDQADVLERIDALEISLETVLEQQAEMSQQVSDSQDQIDELQATTEAMADQSEEIDPAELLREVRMLHVLELLDRGRLYLLQNNLGLAEEDVLTARDILAVIQETANTDQQPNLEDWIGRLESIADSLPASPRLASIDLETVWNLMISESSQAWSAGTLTPLNLSTEATPEASETPELTPTATPTPK
jgi:hypothetical protein